MLSFVLRLSSIKLGSEGVRLFAEVLNRPEASRSRRIFSRSTSGVELRDLRSPAAEGQLRDVFITLRFKNNDTVQKQGMFSPTEPEFIFEKKKQIVGKITSRL